MNNSHDKRSYSPEDISDKDSCNAIDYLHDKHDESQDRKNTGIKEAAAKAALRAAI